MQQNIANKLWRQVISHQQNMLRPRSPFLFIIIATLVGCNSSSPIPPQFELMGFSVREEKTPATDYTKEWNSFKGVGTVVARNVSKDKNVVVLLEIRDETKGPSAEPELGSVLVRGGIGKLEINKGKYGEISPPPKYNWNVIGWYELHPAKIEVAGQQTK